MKILLLGAGHKKYPEITLSTERKLRDIGEKDDWSDCKIIRLDINDDCKPDVVWDLNKRPLPFKDEEFDEIHAYSVLEHIGKQGDYKEFFEEFNEYARILRSGGRMLISVPTYNDLWAWSDPGHVRILTKETFCYLNKHSYKQLGKTSLSDYRKYLKCNLIIIAEKTVNNNYHCCLLKI